jgi:hypothetical protein
MHSIILLPVSPNGWYLYGEKCLYSKWCSLYYKLHVSIDVSTGKYVCAYECVYSVLCVYAYMHMCGSVIRMAEKSGTNSQV